MTRYEKLLDSELDNLLVLNFHPSRKERINFNDYSVFSELIIKKIKAYMIGDDFGDNILFFLSVSNKPSKNKKEQKTGELIFMALDCDMRIYKMAALKTFDENKELIRL